MRLASYVAAFAVLAAHAGCACGPPPCGGPGTICRLAGTGARGFNGDGLQAIETELYLVSAARVGPDGRVYLMDFNNQRLRVIESDGRVATVAGNGQHEFARIGVAATDSPLENPVDFDFGPSDELYFVSVHDPRVLTIDAAGLLDAVAGTGFVGDSGDGGPAATATFTELSAIAVARDRSIFVADSGANRVRVIRPKGTVEAFAGTGVGGYSGDGGSALTAELLRPSALALGTDGALYLAEAGNHVVRRVLPSGIIETVGGTGTAGFAGDGGPATVAQLRAPEGVIVAPDGAVHVADTGNDRIRRVDPAGVISTLAGTGARGLSGDGGPALGANLARPARLSLGGDTLYVADQLNSCVRTIQLR